MRRTVLVFLLLSMASLAVAAEGEFVANGDSDGTTVIWFTPTTIDTVFTGTLDLAGELAFSTHHGVFTASGDSHGSGVADGMTFATDLWILFTASGRFDSGEEVGIRGGIAVHSDTIDMATMSMGSGPGEFFAIIDVQTASYRVAGTLTSDASGQMVAPDDPTTMQVEGGATFGFNGNEVSQETAIESLLPWNVGDWPEDLHAELVALLTGAPSADRAPQEEAPADGEGETP